MPSKTPSILVGALVLTVISVFASAVLEAGGGAARTLGCLLLFVAAVVAVAHYTTTNRVTLKAGQGASLGLMATLVGLLISFAIGYVLQELGLTPSFEEVTEMEMARQREKLAAGGMSDKEIDQALSFAGGSQLVASGIALALGAIAGAITGALSALVFKKGEAEEG